VIEPANDIVPHPLVESTGIADILSALELRAGVDFSAYRQPTVERRIRSRMMTLGISSFADYLARLRRCQDEPGRLIERITIKMSRFYRHPPTFDCLRESVLPQLARQRNGAPVRIWSLGTGAGEEAYTLAMLLDEAGIPGTIQASDIDAYACESGRGAIYPGSSLIDLPDELAQRYLQPVEGSRDVRFRVRNDLRGRVRFSVYDATRPGPPPGEGCFDLILCRNLLIYLQLPAQTCVLKHLRCAMSDDGFICLGEAEWPPRPIAATLQPLASHLRIFRAATEAQTHAKS
jgi:chemotaxis methyl-accepting protein methylase